MHYIVCAILQHAIRVEHRDFTGQARIVYIRLHPVARLALRLGDFSLCCWWLCGPWHREDVNQVIV